MLSKSFKTNKYFWYDEEIAESEYNHIKSILCNIPAAPEGYNYKLSKELVWEIYKLEEVGE